MTKLVNIFAWSQSRFNAFKVCKRRHYYKTYLMWGGWERYADPREKLSYRLSKMTNLHMASGNIVHLRIKQALQDARQGITTIADPAYLESCANELYAAWRNAEAQRWTTSPKKFPPFFELYYTQENHEKALEQSAQQIQLTLQTFLNSSFYEDLLFEEPKRWLALDEDINSAPDYLVKDIKVWVIPDFIRQTAAGRYEIWDWKTGKPSSNDHQQLLAYAGYVQARWQVPAEQIDLYTYYLNPDKTAEPIRKFECNQDAIDFRHQKIVEDSQQLQSVLKDPAHNTPLPEHEIPKTRSQEQCNRCHFKEVCR